MLNPALHAVRFRGNLLRALEIIPKTGRAHVLAVLHQLLAQMLDLKRLARLLDHPAHFRQVLLKDFHFQHKRIHPS